MEVKNLKITISILMACYNAEKFIEQSLYSCLTQTEVNYEVIISDDCSTDST